jgi:AAA domain
MAELRVVHESNPDDFHLCACGYSWISDDPKCPKCGELDRLSNRSDPILIDWAEFWNRDPSTEDWLIWPLVPAGRGVALYAPAKAGKSLIVLALAAMAATGQASLDGSHRDPVNVLYLDYEMTLDDLQERLEAFGYGPESDLTRLHYASLPSLPNLNSPEGAKRVIELVEATSAQVVVIDTFGRAVDGEENSNDVTRDFYRWTGLALKAINVAFLRTDHAGKDVTKGQRGGSAKNDDVDLVWQLTRVHGGVMLKATHRRMGWVPEQVMITVDDSKGWELTTTNDESYPAGVMELAGTLDSLGVSVDASSTTCNRAIKTVDPDGKGRQKALVLATQRYRRSVIPDVLGSENGSGNRSRTVLSAPPIGTVYANTDLPGTEPVSEPGGTDPPDDGSPGSPPIGGTGTSPNLDEPYEAPF